MEAVRKTAMWAMLALLVSCSGKESTLAEFHGDLDTMATVELLDRYFSFEPAGKSAQVAPTYDSLFRKIKANLAQGAHEALKYPQAREDWADVALVNPEEDQSDLLVVRYANGEYLYVKFSGGKIQSMISIKKGNLISNWL